MPVLSENKCVSTRFELGILCIEAERERFPKNIFARKCLLRQALFKARQDDKPGYVVNGHLSRSAVASGFKRPT